MVQTASVGMETRCLFGIANFIEGETNQAISRKSGIFVVVFFRDSVYIAQLPCFASLCLKATIITITSFVNSGIECLLFFLAISLLSLFPYPVLFESHRHGDQNRCTLGQHRVFFISLWLVGPYEPTKVKKKGAA